MIPKSTYECGVILAVFVNLRSDQILFCQLGKFNFGWWDTYSFQRCQNRQFYSSNLGLALRRLLQPSSSLSSRSNRSLLPLKTWWYILERVESCFSSYMLASAIPSPSFPSSRSRSYIRRVFLRLTLHRSLILCSSSEMLSAACYLRDACCSHFFSLVPVPSPSPVQQQ